MSHPPRGKTPAPRSPRERHAAVLLVLALAAPTAAGSDLVDRIQRAYDGLERLSADFEQVLHSGLLGAEEPERGRLMVARPGKMRWDYLVPEPKVAIVDEGRAWLWLREENEIECYQLGELIEEDVVGNLLAGTVRLGEEFRVTVLEGDAGDATLRLQPRDLSEDYDEIHLTVDVETLLPRRVDLLDPVGNRLEYRFLNVRRNPDLPRDAFREPVPRDVRWSERCRPAPWIGP